jgi:hypothetical protein
MIAKEIGPARRKYIDEELAARPWSIPTLVPPLDRRILARRIASGLRVVPDIAIERVAGSTRRALGLVFSR